MHFHYYTLCHLARYLNEHHQGDAMQECFSQNRNELVLNLDHLILRIGCQTPLSYVIPGLTFAKAKRNVVDLFQEIWGKKLLKARVVSFERVMILVLEDEWEMVLKMHGTMANVMLRQGGELKALFNNQREGDWAYEEEAGVCREELLEEAQPENEKEVRAVLRQISVVYEKQYAMRVWQEMESGKSFKEAYQLVVAESESDVFWVERSKRKIQFFLFKPASDNPVMRVEGIFAALETYFRLHFQYNHYLQTYNRLDKEIRQPYKKLYKLYESYQRNVAQIESARSSEEIGHILMANLHAIETGEKQVELHDFYTDQPIKIKLKAKLSPQENAALYYEKHKDRKRRMSYLVDQLEDMEERLLAEEEKIEEFEKLVPPADLHFGENGFDREEMKQMRVFAKAQTKEKKAKDKEKYPFRYFPYEGYEIFVGRNAKNNDLLSFKFANKADLWLHAKDVTGSHVVIRHKAGQEIPVEVLEYAASLAAYYSKRKSDSLVPVQYTIRKYIRKRKGDLPGQVVVEREKVLMIEPWEKEGM